jgi:hypothetical protein
MSLDGVLKSSGTARIRLYFYEWRYFSEEAAGEEGYICYPKGFCEVRAQRVVECSDERILSLCGPDRAQ